MEGPFISPGSKGAQAEENIIPCDVEFFRTLQAISGNRIKCLKTAVQEMKIPLEVAVRCASENPAKAIGVFDRCGSIAAEKDADLVLLDHDLDVKAVWIAGSCVGIH